MRAILDTNIVMSGIFWTGHARNILLLLEQGRFEHVCSKEIIEEYFATVEKLKSKLKREDRGIIDEILDMIVMRSHFGLPPCYVHTGPINTALMFNFSPLVRFKRGPPKLVPAFITFHVVTAIILFNIYFASWAIFNFILFICLC
jgi:hypothetical protein